MHGSAPTGSPAHGRRACLLLAAAGLATACAPSLAVPRERAQAPTGTPAGPPASAPPVVPVTAAVGPTREEVVARYAGGAPAAFAALADTLRTTGTPATLFLDQRWILAHPDLAAELAADPLFELADHGTVHLPLSVRGAPEYWIAGTTDPGAVFDEITGNRRTLSR